MTLTQKLLGVATFGVAFASVSFAQTTTSTTTAASLLGVQYVEATFGYTDIKNVDRGIYSAGANVNFPINANLDLGVSYSHDWLENNDSFYQNVLGASATAYLTEGNLRPFVGGALGYVWEGSGDDNYGVWAAGAGVEYSINASTAVRLSGTYSDSFEGNDDGAFSGSVGINHWFTSTISGTFDVTYLEGGNIAYTAGVLFKF